jgi:hypothetical protein
LKRHFFRASFCFVFSTCAIANAEQSISEIPDSTAALKNHSSAVVGNDPAPSSAPTSVNEEPAKASFKKFGVGLSSAPAISMPQETWATLP